MKKIRAINPFLGSALAVIFFLSSCGQHVEEKQTEEVEFLETTEVSSSGIAANTIKLALLLDTSNSMDGLIEQAKSQLWKIVNELSMASKNGHKAELLISLYEYGNDDLDEKDGYIRQVLPFTNDLDTLSQELFALNTLGGEEYCGEVISQSINDLDWEEFSEGLQVIVIAGNEEFNQGETDYKKICEKAKASDIYVNTIYCGDEEQGRSELWSDGAMIGNGHYGTINMDEATVYIETPYDQKINALNVRLNETYIPYGSLGNSKYQNMETQDYNASSYGTANTTERTLVKSKKHMYKNDSWDLVDASEKKDFDINKIKDAQLPSNMQGMSEDEKITYINTMSEDRTRIQNEIAELGKKRSEYIDQKKKEMDGGTSLEDAIISAIKKQAKAKNFTFTEDIAAN